MKQKNRQQITLREASVILKRYSLKLGGFVWWANRNAGFVPGIGQDRVYKHDVYTYIQKVRYNEKGQLPET